MLKNRYNRVMSRKVLKVVSVAVIGLSVLVAFTLSASAADPSAECVGVEDANGYKNANVTVPVNITNPQDGPIVVIKFNLLYNRSIINVTALHKGALTSDFSNWDLGYPPWGIAVTISTTGAGLQNGKNGSVAVLNLSVLGEPGETSYMNLSGIELSNSTGGTGFNTPPKNGTFTVGGAQAWYLHNDTRMYKGNMSKPEGTLTIVNGGTTNWTANEAATVDVEFPAGNWTGWLTLNATFAATENFTVAVGSYNTTAGFSTAGTQKFIGDGSAKAFLDIPAEEFTVPKGNNLSLQVSNPSTTLVIKTGAGNSFITSPETDPGYPVPELSITILFSVGLLALAAYILRPRFLKR